VCDGVPQAPAPDRKASSTAASNTAGQGDSDHPLAPPAGMEQLLAENAALRQQLEALRCVNLG